MAEKRMFSKSVVRSDAFMNMPLSAQCLYFVYGMEADDDGFVSNPKSLMRACGASQSDIDELVNKRYILMFPSGVVVIKHWRMNNYLKKDRYAETTYLEEKAMLMLDDKGAYTERPEGVESNLDMVKSRRPLTEAQQKRLDAKKESSLPGTFENQIRNAFVGKRCPICGVIMDYRYSQNKPTIQHNKPISLGGKHEIDNISVICMSCNSSIQNKVETPSYNTEEVKEIWECFGNVSGMYPQDRDRDRLGKDRIGKVNNKPSDNPFLDILIEEGE